MAAKKKAPTRKTTVKRELSKLPLKALEKGLKAAKRAVK